MNDLTLYPMDGYELWAHPQSRVAQKLKAGVPYEHQLLHHTKGRYEGTVVDVGASIGNHSLYWWADGLEVYAFEPNPTVYKQLLLNAMHNDATAIRCYQMALSNNSLTGRMNGAMQLVNDPAGDVTAKRWDDITDIPVAMVKVDVEGHEPQVLAGMARMLDRDHPDIYTESHTDRARYEVYRVLKPLGYQLARSFDMGSRMDWWVA